MTDRALTAGTAVTGGTAFYDTKMYAVPAGGSPPWGYLAGSVLAAAVEQYIHQKGTDIASAGTITVAQGDEFHVTGTTTITNIDFSPAYNGRGAWLVFDGALTLTHNSTTLILPGAASITTAAGDRAYFKQDSGDNVICAVYTKANGQAVSGTSTSKGRVEILANIVPATLGAPLTALAGASTPAESIPYYEFVNGSTTYREFYCRVQDYAGGGLTLKFGVMRTSAAAGATYIFDAAIRRINTGTEDLGAAHTYDYNTVTVTIPAGPPTATIPMAGVITFTDGADMDNLATDEMFIVRFRRSGGTATDTARVLPVIDVKET